MAPTEVDLLDEITYLTIAHQLLIDSFTVELKYGCCYREHSANNSCVAMLSFVNTIRG